MRAFVLNMQAYWIVQSVPVVIESRKSSRWSCVRCGVMNFLQKLYSASNGMCQIDRILIPLKVQGLQFSLNAHAHNKSIFHQNWCINQFCVSVFIQFYVSYLLSNIIDCHHRFDPTGSVWLMKTHVCVVYLVFSSFPMPIDTGCFEIRFCSNDKIIFKGCTINEMKGGDAEINERYHWATSIFDAAVLE